MLPSSHLNNSSIAAKHDRDSTHVTASKIPVPEPRAPIRSLPTDKAPIQAPPNAAAVGMILLSSLYMLCSRCPAMTNPCSFNCLATSRGAAPLTSIPSQSQYGSIVCRGPKLTGFREQCACTEHKHNIYGGFDRVEDRFGKVQRWGHVVGKARARIKLSAAFSRFPNTEQLDKEVVTESRIQHLRKQEDV